MGGEGKGELMSHVIMVVMLANEKMKINHETNNRIFAISGNLLFSMF